MDSIQGILNTQIIEIPFWGFALNLILAAVLSYFLSVFYVRYGYSLSNRRIFSRNFLLLTVITTLVITIIKSSLALSLGLVGALSIVRFRAAIKEPEELVYLFMTIAIGLGLGADQRFITVAAFFFILAVLRIKDLWLTGKKDEPNLYLNVVLARSKEADLRHITDILKNHAQEVALKRFDETEEKLEASFLIKYDGYGNLDRTKSELRQLAPDIEISFIDNKSSY
ncbi:MAG: hypothetical protein A3A10_00920 [Candidatus Tagabacteria bacterium RIFCSPLOWO2_01_FULL_42_9]|uniref:DUF4956 domain-containing protein n=1 Tax=Candidatus Tagabacteria bacterium RIFCSPLOWO2_01_FULL_42_9 TaxID=1802296 RepID=A0A1G2LTH4_9BACT|nr:MAG: hypothetical protein A3A10_00920 [Candidatus Tagabacteria bacterium RIFCSPLOWO2_01_FULL_42_9]